MDRPLLLEDQKLANVSLAWSRRKTLQFFNERVMPVAYPGRQVVDLTRRRIRYKPGKECKVQYGLKIEPWESRRRKLAVITFRKPAKLERAASEYPQRDEGGVHFIADIPCLVEFYPDDHKVPKLATAVEAAALNRRLAELGDPPGTVTQVRRLRYRPGFSCVVRYTVEPKGGGPSREVIGKVYGREGLAGAVRHKLASLHDQAAQRGLVLPRPLDWPVPDDLVVMEQLSGVNMDSDLLSGEGGADANALIELAAGALASFHTLRCEAPPSRTLEFEFHRLHRRVRRISRVAPELGDLAYRALEPIDEDALVAPPDELCFIHGDYKPNQLIVDGGRAGLVDLDRAGVGDPAVDVGNFMAVLLKKAAVNARPHFRPLAEVFRRRYLAQRPGAALEERVRLCLGIALVRMALAKFERAPRSFARKGASWPWLAVLEEAERCLASA